MKIKPITPDQIQKTIPDIVIEAFNELIQKNWNGSSSRVIQERVLAYIVQNSNYTIKEIYDNRFLDVEDLYRSKGWNVEYQRPERDDLFEGAYFVFSKK